VNPELFEDLIASFVFERSLKETQNFINNFMSALTETTSTRGAVASEGDSPELVSMEILAIVPKS